MDLLVQNDRPMTGHNTTDDAQDSQSASPVATYANGLTASTDRASFDALLRRIEADATLSARDLVRIAELYAVPGSKLTSRAAAVAAISKRFVELARFASNNRKALETRPW
jgi:hypothetical protein